MSMEILSYKGRTSVGWSTTSEFPTYLIRNFIADLLPLTQLSNSAVAGGGGYTYIDEYIRRQRCRFLR
jgi:hypothetical protein